MNFAPSFCQFQINNQQNRRVSVLGAVSDGPRPKVSGVSESAGLVRRRDVSAALAAPRDVPGGAVAAAVAVVGAEAARGTAVAGAAGHRR